MPTARPHAVTAPARLRRESPAHRASAPLGFAGLVLAAIVVGVIVGAMACAAGLGAGGHGTVHAIVTADDGPLSAPAHAGHGVSRTESGNPTDDSVGPDDDAPDRSTSLQAHPGMACLISVDLRFPEPVAVTSSGLLAAGPAAASPDGVVELDPPVPRAS